MAAPLGSDTVPVTAPDVIDWANDWTSPAENRHSQKKKSKEFRDMSCLLPFDSKSRTDPNCPTAANNLPAGA
jgi:hypothetical protein